MALLAVILPFGAGSSLAYGTTTAPHAALAGVNVLGWGLADPHAVTFDGSHVWVANDDSITELNAVTGSYIATIAGPAFQFLDPPAIAADGTNVWVLNADDSVTELTESGDLVRVISGAQYQFYDPMAIASDGVDVWVTSAKPSFQSAGGVTEIDAATGALVRFIPLVDESPAAIALAGGHVWVSCSSLIAIDPATGTVQMSLDDPKYGFASGVGALSVSGSDLWVSGTDRLTEIDSSTGALVRVINGQTHRFRRNSGLAADSAHIWVSGSWGVDYVTELSAATGKVVRVISGSKFGFRFPVSPASNGAQVWVASPSMNHVTVINAATGALVKIVHGSPYQFSRPSALTVSLGHVWVTNYTGNSISELDATTGQLMRV